MGNCLVTKLKEVVNNDSLPVLNTIVIPILGAEGKRSIARLGGSSSKPVLVSLPNGTLYDGGSDVPYEQPASRPVNRYMQLVCTVNSKLYIEEKYNLVGLNITKYSGSAGSLSGLIPADFYLKLNEFAYCTDLEELSLGSMDVNGDISALSKCTKISALGLGYGNFTGDYVTLVKSWIANGRNSVGNVSINYTYYNTTYSGTLRFNGKAIPMDAINAVAQLSWESLTKVVLLISGNHKALCVGYSDSDIATKTASGGDWEGYTVTKCD